MFGLKYPVSLSVIWLGDHGILVGCGQTTPTGGYHLREQRQKSRQFTTFGSKSRVVVMCKRTC